MEMSLAFKKMQQQTIILQSACTYIAYFVYSDYAEVFLYKMEFADAKLCFEIIEEMRQLGR